MLCYTVLYSRGYEFRENQTTQLAVGTQLIPTQSYQAQQQISTHPMSGDQLTATHIYAPRQQLPLPPSPPLTSIKSKTHIFICVHKATLRASTVN